MNPRDHRQGGSSGQYPGLPRPATRTVADFPDLTWRRWAGDRLRRATGSKYVAICWLDPRGAWVHMAADAQIEPASDPIQRACQQMRAGDTLLRLQGGDAQAIRGPDIPAGLEVAMLAPLKDAGVTKAVALCWYDDIRVRDDLDMTTVMDGLDAVMDRCAALREQARFGQLEARVDSIGRAAGQTYWECDNNFRLTWVGGALLDAGSPQPMSDGSLLPNLEISTANSVGAIDRTDVPLHADAARLHGYLRSAKALVSARMKVPAATGEFSVAVAASPLFDANGQIVGYQGNFTRLAMHNASSISERGRRVLTHELVNQVPGFIAHVLIDRAREARLLFVGGDAAELLGYPSVDTYSVRTKMLSSLSSGDRRQLWRKVRRAAQTGRDVCAHIAMPRPDGSRVPLLIFLRAKPAADELLNVYAYVCATGKFGLLHDTEEAVARERQRSIAFLSRASHELRTPLNGILGFVQLMALEQDDYLVGVQRERLSYIETAAKRLLTLTNEMLELGRLSETGSRLLLRPINLFTAVQRGIEILLPEINSRQIDLLIERPDDPVFVLGNEDSVIQVVVNLVSNAIKYGGDRRPVIVRTEVRDASVELSVSDLGPGLRPEQKASLFEPFSRVGAENSVIEGSGIGLAIAKALAQGMHGDIEVESDPGQGATFTLCLELAKSDEATLDAGTSMPDSPMCVVSFSEPSAPEAECDSRGTQAPAASISDESIQNHPRASSSPERSIYVVEDDRLNMAMIVQALSRAPDWQVTSFDDGESAWRAIQAARPDLLVADINLPHMTGLELVARVRAECGESQIPCIAVSADVLPENIERGLAAGFDAYLTKPLILTDLVARIAALLAQTKTV